MMIMPSPRHCVLLLAALACLVVLGAGAPAPGPAVAPADAEAAILHRLRAVLAETDPAWVAPWRGWQPSDGTHHCQWDNIRCEDSRVTAIKLSVAPRVREPAPWDVEAQPTASLDETALSWGPLQPELAQLEWLVELYVERFKSPPYAGVPADWFQPGAFKRLRSLSLTRVPLQQSLPDAHPGALPELEQLYIESSWGPVHLPASWGARPDVLPALRVLSLQAPAAGTLPAQWWRGFRQLRQLILSDVKPLHPLPLSWRDDVPRTASTLPAAWSAGFPLLNHLSLSWGAPLTGSIPASWIDAGKFPNLQFLSLSGNLTGPLPAQLLPSYPRLMHLALGDCSFTGTLPSEWATSEVQELLLAGNRLDGPAFPPAWLGPGAFPRLLVYDISDNAGLGGTLPATLAWPALEDLEVSHTGVHGSIPAQWCRPPLNKTLQRINVKGSQVEPGLPPCAAHDLVTTVFLTNSTSATANVHNSLQGTPARHRHAWVALVALVPVLSLAAAAFATYRLQQLRREQRSSDLEWQDVQSLLVAVQQSRTRHKAVAGPGEPGGASPARLSSASSAPSKGVHTLGGSVSTAGSWRRARLQALLNAQVAGGAGAKAGGSRRAVEMLPLESLPTVLAHQLGSLRRGGASSHVLGEGGSAGPAACGAHSPPKAWDAQRAAAVEAWAAVSLTAGPPAGALHSRSPPRSRQWGMATDSLRLTAGEVEFLVDGDGKFVELGSGSYAVVYLAKLQGRPVAVKVFELEAGMDSGVVWREVSLLQRCHHPRIVQLLGVALKAELVLIAMEVMRGGSLRTALQDAEVRERLRWAHWGQQVALDIAEALDFLHGQGIIHSDCKAANVLLTGDGRACLADLGLAQVLAGRAATPAGFSRVYAAPEQLLGQRCTLAADMYSFGILLIELLTQKHWDVRGQWRLPRAPDECPTSIVTLIQECTYSDPLQRPTAAQALSRLRAEVAGAPGAGQPGHQLALKALPEAPPEPCVSTPLLQQAAPSDAP